jgi:hypothetical protein
MHLGYETGSHVSMRSAEVTNHHKPPPTCTEHSIRQPNPSPALSPGKVGPQHRCPVTCHRRPCRRLPGNRQRPRRSEKTTSAFSTPRLTARRRRPPRPTVRRRPQRQQPHCSRQQPVSRRGQPLAGAARQASSRCRQPDQQPAAAEATGAKAGLLRPPEPRQARAGHQPAGLGLGTKNREPRTETEEPGTGTERTGTDKIGSMFGSCFLGTEYPRLVRFGSRLTGRTELPQIQPKTSSN